MNGKCKKITIKDPKTGQKSLGNHLFSPLALEGEEYISRCLRCGEKQVYGGQDFPKIQQDFINMMAVPLDKISLEYLKQLLEKSISAAVQIEVAIKQGRTLYGEYEDAYILAKVRVLAGLYDFIAAVKNAEHIVSHVSDNAGFSSQVFMKQVLSSLLSIQSNIDDYNHNRRKGQ